MGVQTYKMKSDRFLSLTLGVLLFAWPYSGAQASWQPDKRLSFDSGRSGLSTGNAHCVAVDTLGNVHVVWHDDTPGNYEIEYVIFDSLSAWPPTPRRLTTNSGASLDPSAATMPDTSIFVVWVDDSERPAPSVNFARFYPHVAVLLDSGFVSTEIFPCSGPCVAVASDSSVYVAWAQNTGQVSDIFCREWHNGWVGGPSDLSSSQGMCVGASVAADGLRNVHVVWADNVTNHYEIYYRKYTPGLGWNGTFQVSKSMVLAWTPSVTADKDGNVYVVWVDRRDGNFEVYLRRYLYGIGWGNEKRLSYNGGVSSNPSVAVDSEENLHIVWEDFRNGNEEIYYRGITNREGPGWDPVETRLTNDGATSWDPSVAADRFGNVHVVWADNRDSNFEIYYKLGIKSVPVSIDLLALYAESVTEGVAVRWEVTFEGNVAFFDVYRKDDDGDSLVKVTREPLFAQNEFLDTHVSSGVTYQYFLGIWQGEGEEQALFGPVSVTYFPPFAATLPHLAVWPNPSTGAIRVSFAAKRDNAPFKLTLIDVNGRVVGDIASGAASVGVTSFPFDLLKNPARSLSPGIYFVSLEMDGKLFEKKIVLLK